MLNTELWSEMPVNDTNSPRLYRGTLTVEGEPADTFLRPTESWIKGVVFVNGFNVGRYWNAGPQKTLYIPAPLLKTGENQVKLRRDILRHISFKLCRWGWGGGCEAHHAPC